MYAFIGGTSAAGKTYTAKRFAEQSNFPIQIVSIDELRVEFGNKDPKVKYWVDFFWNQNEEEYWKTVTRDQDINNLVQQSEAMWASILDVVENTKKAYPHAIFEAVNILPHLAKKDLDFPGMFIVNEDEKTTLERFKKDPRWGKSEELQRLEVKHLIQNDIQFIKEEAEKYNYPVIYNSNGALIELGKIFK